MAVEARRLNLFPPRPLASREMINPVDAGPNIYNTQMGYRLPLSAATSTTETLLPLYNSLITDSFPHKTPIKSESGLSYNHLPVSRKRSRDSINPLLSYSNPPSNDVTAAAAAASPLSFLGQDISFQMQQQQLDIDRLITQQMEKVKMELEDERKRQARWIIEAIEKGMLKRLKAREEEIEKIGKLNWALQEKVKALCMENQIWRDLAQTTEATANALRTNLEQVLAAAQFKEERTRCAGLDDAAAAAAAAAAAETEDAESCCGSSDEGERWTLGNGEERKTRMKSRMCRNCSKEESCVLLLPCRHLCLCTVCGSKLDTCPICKATKNASFVVNMS